MKSIRYFSILLFIFLSFGCASNKVNSITTKHFVIDDVMMTPILEECQEEMEQAISENWSSRTKPSLLISTVYDERFGEGQVTVISYWIQESLFTNFISSKKYKIIDRQDIERLRNEKKFQQAGYVDDKVMVDEGRELGGNYLIVAKISEYDTFNCKITNLETGEIIYSVAKQIKAGAIK